MTVVEKAEAVERLFKDLDSAIAKFQEESSLHCAWGCGKCCFKADIEATPLEFLPFAIALHQTGRTAEWLTKLDHTTSTICLILNPTREGAGLCSEYTHRGLICRLFGYSARTNKYGNKELVTCQIIKTEQEPAYRLASEKINDTDQDKMPVPVMSEYYFQLQAIDPILGSEYYPINTAIKKAIEAVLHYYAYRTPGS